MRGSRHTLIVRKVQASDFGNYSCVADNVVGKSRAYVELSGKNKHFVHPTKLYFGIKQRKVPPTYLTYTMMYVDHDRRRYYCYCCHYYFCWIYIDFVEILNSTRVNTNTVIITDAFYVYTGKPNPVKINSNKNGRHQNNYNISWSVDSYTPIEEFKLFYRKVPLPDESPADTRTQYQWPKKPPTRNVSRAKQKNKKNILLARIYLFTYINLQMY